MPVHLNKKIVVNCFPFLSPWLAQEIRQLAYTPESVDRMGVTLLGDYSDTLRLNYYLRTATRVLFEVSSFQASTPDELYREILRIPWENIIPSDGYISFGGFVRNENIKDNRFAHLKAKDAVVDRLKEKTGRRPDAGSESNRTVLFLHWVNNLVSIYIDTSGETIAKHGYRQMPGKAPMMEALACAVIMATGWQGEGPFINPMCGSGTLAIEAALQLRHVFPGMFRENFGFMHTLLYDQAEWQKVRNEGLNKRTDGPFPRILATDHDQTMIDITRKNAKQAGVDHLIELVCCDFKETEIPPRKGGIAIMNPPYGERIGEEEELKQTYSDMGDFFKQKCKTYRGYIFTGNLELAKSVGLKTTSRTEFYNARIESRLLEYELYAGSKKRDKLTE